MDKAPSKVLFVDRHNSCRGLLAEACLRHLGRDKVKVYSCGVPSDIADGPDSWTLLALDSAGISSIDLTCKGWTGLTRSGAPSMDFVIALDAQTFGAHPKWRGQPETALWSYPEISQGKDRKVSSTAESIQTLVSLRRRIELLVSLISRAKTHSDLRDDLRDLAYV
jgi:arsenate reductase